MHQRRILAGLQSGQTSLLGVLLARAKLFVGLGQQTPQLVVSVPDFERKTYEGRCFGDFSLLGAQQPVDVGIDGELAGNCFGFPLYERELLLRCLSPIDELYGLNQSQRLRVALSVERFAFTQNLLHSTCLFHVRKAALREQKRADLLDEPLIVNQEPLSVVVGDRGRVQLLIECLFGDRDELMRRVQMFFSVLDDLTRSVEVSRLCLLFPNDFGLRVRIRDGE